VDEKTGYGTSTMALNGPSRLQGNLHGRFRGGLGSAMGPAHPTETLNKPGHFTEMDWLMISPLANAKNRYAGENAAVASSPRLPAAHFGCARLCGRCQKPHDLPGHLIGNLVGGRNTRPCQQMTGQRARLFMTTQ